MDNELVAAIEALVQHAYETDSVGCDHEAGICNCDTTNSVHKVKSWLASLQKKDRGRD